MLNRISRLADRPVGAKPARTIPFKNLIPLQEIIADAMHVGTGAKQVAEQYKEIIRKIGSEFKVLLEAKREDILAVSLPEIAEGIMRVRERKVNIRPGYDGEYGKISIFGKNGQQKKISGQKTLF